MLNVFIYVVRREDDPFYGFKDAMRRRDVDYIDLIFSDETYDHIRDVEYTTKRYLRFLYYKKVYNELYSRLKELLISNGDEEVFIYLADEGFWAEMLKKIKVHLVNDSRSVKIVNVQHGFFDIERRRSEQGLLKKARVIVNTISAAIVGFPFYGYGFGGSKLDYYFVYTPLDKEFLLRHGVKRVYFTPKIIKQGFIEKYQKMKIECGEVKRLLFVMPHFVKEPGYSLKLDEFADFLLPILSIFRNIYNYEIVLRPHPGMSRQEWDNHFHRTALAKIVVVDREHTIVEAISRSSLILSLNSTALFESLIVGKIPIKVESPYIDCELHYPHKVISCKFSLEAQIRNLLEEIDSRQKAQIEWIQDEVSDFVIGIDL